MNGLLATRGMGTPFYHVRPGRLGLETELYYHPQATYKPLRWCRATWSGRLTRELTARARPPNLAQVETARRSLVEEEKVCHRGGIFMVFPQPRP